MYAHRRRDRFSPSRFGPRFQLSADQVVESEDTPNRVVPLANLVAVGPIAGERQEVATSPS